MKPLQITPTSPASIEPISLSEARDHLRLIPFGSPLAHPQDELIESLILAARAYAEEYTQKKIKRETYVLALDGFPSANTIGLETWPVIEVSSIVYTDQNGQTQTLDLDAIVLDNFSQPAEIFSDTPWPATKSIPNSVRISFVAGFDGEDGLPLPDTLRQAMLISIKHFYDNPGAISGAQVFSIPQSVERLLDFNSIRTGL